MNISELIKKHQLSALFRQGQFGIEKENIRVNELGQISQTPHPKAFRQHSKHPFITRDFAEAQIELISPICQNIKEACDFIKMLHHLVSLELEHEYLWPYSQPPVLPQDLSSITIAQFPQSSARQYRDYLSKKYGKARQLLSGVHFNFSLTSEFLSKIYALSPKQGKNYQEFCNEIYLKMARFYLKHAWLIVLLSGQGHITHQSYEEKERFLAHRKQRLGPDAIGLSQACSKRNGIEGYRNPIPLSISYQSLEAYIKDLKNYIKTKEIESLREYYSSVRLKSTQGIHTLRHLSQQGIHYLEIRSLDLNPHEIEGISESMLGFLHLFLLFGLCCDEDLNTSLDYQQAMENQFLVADGDLNLEMILQNKQQSITLKNAGNALFKSMLDTFSNLNFPDADLRLIQQYQNLFNHPQQLPRFQLVQNIEKQGFQSYFLDLSQKYHLESQKWCYQLYGYQDLELSTQILIREAVLQGLHFNFLDRQDNFLEFWGNKRSQWVKQATKTTLDTYITFLAMENKSVTKTLVSQHHLIVPNGKNYQDTQAAKQSYSIYANQDIVIKPNMTNFGLGVTILKHPFTPDEFEQAVAHAFSYDQKILIEHFFPGKEFRFLVIDGQTVAVLNREPANVIGDGQHSIEELVDIKNQDPRRGNGYKKPLEQIKIDSIVIAYLQKQGLNTEDIPEYGKKIYLRENSNVSTGGDSIDYTDTMPQAYKNLAVKAAKAVDAIICGVDMIIKDYQIKNPKDNYCILELNFNPAIQMHTYPYVGQDRKVAKHLLKALGLI